MIDRYTREELKKLWSEQHKFDCFLKVEIFSLYGFCKLGIIPLEDIEKIIDKLSVNVERIKEIESITKHDIVAFTRQLSEEINDYPERKWIHYGLTSSDVIDTANGYIMKEVNDILEGDIIKLIELLKKKALEYEKVPCIGRTHGIHADITSFGLKYALWYDEMERNYERFLFARKQIEVGKISGAVGNFSNTHPFVQDYVCEKLGIGSANISTQVLQRDRHAYYVATLGLVGATIEKIATELRSLQRTEIREVEEMFSSGQKGSSAMPHKKNPISSENLTGIARLLRGYITPSYEDVALWHERDISHSSVERVVLPDATTLLDYALNRLCDVISNLQVNESNMLDNIFKTNGVIFSQRVLNALIEKGLSREAAYDLVQPIALDAFNKGLDFKELLLKNNELRALLTEKEIVNCFTLEYYFKYVELIYERCGIK